MDDPPERSDHSIVIVGLARDCGEALKSSLAFCEGIGRAFSRSFVVFVENGSKDSTRPALAAWTGTHENSLILTPDEPPNDGFRTERIAACRNLAMDFIRQKLADYDLLLAIDMDIDLDASPSNIKDVLSAAKQLMSDPATDGLFPNSRPVYYDLFALRHPFWCPDDVWQDVDRGWRELSWDDACRYPPAAQFVHSRQMHIPTHLPPIKVDSAFGGLGLYRLAAALGATYRGADDQGLEICEHVGFNKQLKGNLYVVPSWSIHAPLEHLSSAFRVEDALERRMRRQRQRQGQSKPQRLLSRIFGLWKREPG